MVLVSPRGTLRVVGWRWWDSSTLPLHQDPQKTLRRTVADLFLGVFGNSWNGSVWLHTEDESFTRSTGDDYIILSPPSLLKRTQAEGLNWPRLSVWVCLSGRWNSFLIGPLRKFGVTCIRKRFGSCHFSSLCVDVVMCVRVSGEGRGCWLSRVMETLGHIITVIVVFSYSFFLAAARQRSKQ